MASAEGIRLISRSNIHLGIGRWPSSHVPKSCRGRRSSDDNKKKDQTAFLIFQLMLRGVLLIFHSYPTPSPQGFPFHFIFMKYFLSNFPAGRRYALPSTKRLYLSADDFSIILGLQEQAILVTKWAPGHGNLPPRVHRGQRVSIFGLYCCGNWRYCQQELVQPGGMQVLGCVELNLQYRLSHWTISSGRSKICPQIL